MSLLSDLQGPHLQWQELQLARGAVKDTDSIPAGGPCTHAGLGGTCRGAHAHAGSSEVRGNVQAAVRWAHAQRLTLRFMLQTPAWEGKRYDKMICALLLHASQRYRYETSVVEPTGMAVARCTPGQ